MASLRRTSQETEDYWGDSKVKSNRVNFFDDNITVETAESLAKSKKLLQEDEDVELCDWDGSHVSLATESAKSMSGEGVSFQPMTGGGVSFQPMTGSMSYSKSTEKFTEPKVSFSKTTSSISKGLSNLSIDEALAPVLTKDEKDPAKLTEQIEMLKRSLMRTREKPLVEDTIKSIVLGRPYNLEMYKSLDDKISLLDKALTSHDGNAIIAAILFLKRTVKHQIFNLEIQKRPAAISHYISYLQLDYRYREMGDMLAMLGRTEDEAMLRYKQAISSYDVGGKIACLKGCLKAHFANDPALSLDSQMVREHIAILERQRPIEESDSAAEREGRSAMFKQHPRVSTIINKPVMTTLYYCCYYHPGLQENHLASPAAIKKEHNLTDKQFLWMALSARSRLRQWTGVEELLTAKGWLGSTKWKAAIGFDRVCEILHRTNAPPDILSKYLNLIDNAERRITLAKKFKCHSVVIDTCVSQRDRVQIVEYMRKLQPGSRDLHNAQDALRSSTIKWKN